MGGGHVEAESELVQAEGSQGARGDEEILSEHGEPAGERESPEDEEAGSARMARDPAAPAQAERGAHEATHLPFRMWCAACVQWRSDHPPRRRIQDEAPRVPEVSMDNCFVRRSDEGDTVTFLLIKDYVSRAMRDWIVPQKGADLKGTVRQVDGIHDLGHRGRIVLKTDNEPAFLALDEVVAAQLPQVCPPRARVRATGGPNTA